MNTHPRRQKRVNTSNTLINVINERPLYRHTNVIYKCDNKIDNQNIKIVSCKKCSSTNTKTNNVKTENVIDEDTKNSTKFIYKCTKRRVFSNIYQTYITFILSTRNTLYSILILYSSIQINNQLYKGVNVICH